MSIATAVRERQASVLIASAQPSLLRMLVRFVDGHPDEAVGVGTAESASDAIDAARRLHPDVVLLGDELFDEWMAASGADPVAKEAGIVVLIRRDARKQKLEWVERARLTTDLMPAIRRVADPTMTSNIS